MVFPNNVTKIICLFVFLKIHVSFASVTLFPVHQMAEGLPFDVMIQVFRKDFHDPVHGVGQGHISGGMRGQEGVGRCPEGILLRDGLLLEDIQAGAEPAALQLFGERLLVNDGTAAYVNHDGAVREFCQLFLPQHMEGFLCSRKGDEQDIRFAENGFPVSGFVPAPVPVLVSLCPGYFDAVKEVLGVASAAVDADN